MSTAAREAAQGGREVGRVGGQAGSTPRGRDAGKPWREKGGCGGGGWLPVQPALRAAGNRAGRAHRDPNLERGWGAPRAGWAREHKSPVSPWPVRAAAPVGSRPPAPSAGACAAAPSLLPKLRPPRQLLKCRLLLSRPDRPAGRGPSGAAD